MVAGIVCPDGRVAFIGVALPRTPFSPLPNDFLVPAFPVMEIVSASSKMKGPFVQRAGRRVGLPMPVRGFKRSGQKGRRLSFDGGPPGSAVRALRAP